MRLKISVPRTLAAVLLCGVILPVTGTVLIGLHHRIVPPALV
jgi:hypothetical protein